MKASHLKLVFILPCSEPLMPKTSNPVLTHSIEPVSLDYSSPQDRRTTCKKSDFFGEIHTRSTSQYSIIGIEESVIFICKSRS